MVTNKGDYVLSEDTSDSDVQIRRQMKRNKEIIRWRRRESSTNPFWARSRKTISRSSRDSKKRKRSSKVSTSDLSSVSNESVSNSDLSERLLRSGSDFEEDEVDSDVLSDVYSPYKNRRKTSSNLSTAAVEKNNVKGRRLRRDLEKGRNWIPSSMKSESSFVWGNVNRDKNMKIWRWKTKNWSKKSMNKFSGGANWDYRIDVAHRDAGCFDRALWRFFGRPQDEDGVKWQQRKVIWISFGVILFIS